MSLSTLPSRFSSTVSLVETLEPATIAMSGRFGLLSAFSSASSSFVSNGPAQATGANLPDPVRARLGAMRGGEGVHHVDVAERGHLLRQLVLVLLLALVEAHVLEQHHLARLAGHAAQPVALEAHAAAEQFRQPRRDRRQRELFGRHALLRAAEVGHQHDACIRLLRCDDGRQRRADAGIAGHDAVVDGNVEVFANQDPLAGEVEFVHAEDAEHVSSTPESSADATGAAGAPATKSQSFVTSR